MWEHSFPVKAHAWKAQKTEGICLSSLSKSLQYTQLRTTCLVINKYVMTLLGQSWARIPVLTSPSASGREQIRLLTFVLQWCRPQCHCTVHNGLCQKDKHVCVVGSGGGVSWRVLAVPPGTQKRACACLPSCGIPATPQSWCAPRWRKPWRSCSWTTLTCTLLSCQWLSR